jgi:hypothetical protein
MSYIEAPKALRK